MNKSNIRIIGPEEFDQLPTVADLLEKSPRHDTMCGLWNIDKCELIINYPCKGTANPGCNHYHIIKGRDWYYRHLPDRDKVWYEINIMVYDAVLLIDNGESAICPKCFKEFCIGYAER